MRLLRSSFALASMLVPLAVLSLHCKGGGARGAGGAATSAAGAGGGHGGGGLGGGAGAPVTSGWSGPSPDGGAVVDGTFGGGERPDGGDPDAFVVPPIPCDDAKGDLSRCDALTDGGAATTCLSAALCAKLVQDLQPRSAGLAMECVDGRPAGCGAEELGACLVGSAQLACHPASAGTPPCNALATACAAGDPFGTLDQCLAMAAGLTVGAATSLEACLAPATACDPQTLADCATQLFP